jgi:hypothetical protein
MPMRFRFRFENPHRRKNRGQRTSTFLPLTLRWLWDTGAQKAFDAVQEVPQSDLREPYSATAALLEKMALEQPQL